MTIFTARAVDEVEYGQFAIALTGAYFVQGLIRSLTSEVLVFRYSSSVGRRRRNLADECLSSGFLYAVFAAVVVIALGAITDSLMLLVLAPALAGLIMQDNLRFVLLSHGRSKLATGLDVLSLLATVGFLVVATRAGELHWFVAAWGGATWLSAAVGFAIIRPRIGWRGMRKWVLRTWGESKFFASDFLVTNSVSTASVYLVAFLLGAAAAGQIRAASMLVLPVLLLTRGMTLALAAEANRLVVERRYKSVRKLGLLMSGASFAVVVVWVPFVLLIPLEWLRLLLGASAQGAAEVFPYVAIATAAAGIAAGPSIILKAAGKVTSNLTIKIGVLPFSAGGVYVFALLWGVAGSQLGLALGEAVRSVWAWIWAARWLRAEAQRDATTLIQEDLVRAEKLRAQ